MLEIGVSGGGSLRAWCDIFPNAQHIIGIDNMHDPRVDDIRDSDSVYGNVTYLLGDGTDRSLLDDIILNYGPFDIISDDASHKNDSVIQSFEHLFPTGLKDGGMYIVEDTSVWNSDDFQNRQQLNQLEYFWGLTKLLNISMQDGINNIPDNDPWYKWISDPFKIEKKTHDKIEQCIDRIEFGCGYIAAFKETRYHWIPN